MRVLAIAAVMGLVAAAARSYAQAPGSVAEQYLFQAANSERTERGLPALQWDRALSRAAVLHAREMAARESISHQYPGEADLAARADGAGARFGFVAENVAMATNAVRIHDAWMHSPDHRANLLDGRADHIGISVVSRGGEVYAVEDFDRGVALLSFEEQERAVARLMIATAPLRIQTADEAARRTCGMNTGYAGSRRPWFVMRFTTGELNTLPQQLKTRLATGRFHEAAVGACTLKDSQPFTSYNVAVLLFP